MGIFDTILNLANNDKASRIMRKRAERLFTEGSQPFHYDVPVIAAGGTVDFTIFSQFPLARKYEPLNRAIVINQDVVAIGITINGTLWIVPPGTIRELTKEETPAIWHILITNLDSATATTADKIDIEFSKAPATADDVARGSY